MVLIQQRQEEAMEEGPQSTCLHHPFERVQSPTRSLAPHQHHTIKENGRETSDFGSPQIFNGLTNMLAGWGWLTPECEGPSQSKTSVSEGPHATAHSSESHQVQNSPAINVEVEGASQTSFAEEYGRFVRVLHYDDCNTVQLYEKKVPVVEQDSSPATSPQGSMFNMFRRGSSSKSIRELYAVKVIRHNQDNPVLRLPNFPRNRSEAFSLGHPNIVPIVDILYNGQANLCLVMPYCTGGNLHSFLSQLRKRKESLSTQEKDCLSIQIMRAIAFLHEYGIAHGDMRPEHIFLTGRGAVKVGGFGEDEDAIRALTQRFNGDDPFLFLYYGF